MGFWEGAFKPVEYPVCSACLFIWGLRTCHVIYDANHVIYDGDLGSHYSGGDEDELRSALQGSTTDHQSEP